MGFGGTPGLAQARNLCPNASGWPQVWSRFAMHLAAPQRGRDLSSAEDSFADSGPSLRTASSAAPTPRSGGARCSRLPCGLRKTRPRRAVTSARRAPKPCGGRGLRSDPPAHQAHPRRTGFGVSSPVVRGQCQPPDGRCSGQSLLPPRTRARAAGSGERFLNALREAGRASKALCSTSASELEAESARSPTRLIPAVASRAETSKSSRMRFRKWSNSVIV